MLIGFNEVLVPDSSVCAVELMILFYHSSSHSGNDDSLPTLLSLLIIQEYTHCILSSLILSRKHII